MNDDEINESINDLVAELEHIEVIDIHNHLLNKDGTVVHDGLCELQYGVKNGCYCVGCKTYFCFCLTRQYLLSAPNHEVINIFEYREFLLKHIVGATHHNDEKN